MSVSQSGESPVPRPSLANGLTVGEVSDQLRARLEGDRSLRITGINGIREAGVGDLTYLGDSRYAEWMSRTAAAAVVVRQDWQPTAAAPLRAGLALIRVADPDAAISAVVEQFVPPPAHPPPGFHPTAVIHPTAKIGADAAVGPYAVVEAGAVLGDRCVLYAGVFVGAGAVLGDDCLVYPHVTIGEQVRIGRRVILQPNCVIGADGFGYRPGPTGLVKLRHFGTVILEDDVEIGAGTCVDRARFAATRIGAGTKIDNLVQVGHNVTVGRNTAISGMTGIAGSARIGNQVTIGGHCGIADHITIGDKAMLAAMTGVIKDLPGGQVYSDAPARTHGETLRLLVQYRRLPELNEQFRRLERRLAELEAALSTTLSVAAGTPAKASDPALPPPKSLPQS